MNTITFQIDVSRTYRNKDGYKVGGYRLNNSFKTETHTPESLLDSVIRQGWPYTMVFQKRSPKETGAAAARGVKTAKHTENFVSRQELTGDDDSQAPGVIDFWLHDPFFSQYGWGFVESYNSIPGQAEKGHPTLIFDRPITCPTLYKEAANALAWKYPRLDQGIHNIDRTIYNAENARVHLLGNICPFDVFEREVLTPYRQHLAEQAAIEAEHQAKRQKELEEARAEGRIKTDAPSMQNYIASSLDGIFRTVASAPHTRHALIYWAGQKIGEMTAAGWSSPYHSLFGDVEYRINEAARLNGYLATYAKNNESEVLRTFNDGRRFGALHPAPAPEIYERKQETQDRKQDQTLTEAQQRRQAELERILEEAKQQRQDARERILEEAQQRAAFVSLEFETPIEPAYLDHCEISVEHPVWTSEGGKGYTTFYCNDPLRCTLCRDRMTLKLKWYLDEVSRFAYVDQNGNRAWSKPELNEAGGFVSQTTGPGFWYGKILDEDERRNFRARYRREKPGGFPKPEVYPIEDGYTTRFIVLSLAPFEDMQPLELTDDLLQRIVIGSSHTRSSLWLAPPKKQLELALPRYTFEIPGYLHDRGIIATVPAAYSIVFNGPVTRDDIYSNFKTRADTFDEIGLILEEIAEKSIDSGRLRGGGDAMPDYVIQSIQIVETAKPAYLAVYNAGREGDRATIEKFKRGGLPKLPTFKMPHVNKGIVSLTTIPLTTRFETFPPENDRFYYARLENLLETGAI